MDINTSAIARVTYYQASPVRTCDRCSQGIKHVFRVTFRDGFIQEYGIECINKVLDNAPDLKSLFASNSKRLQKYLGWMQVLNRADAEMPRGSEYFSSGLYFIADEKGKDITGGRGERFFHPVYDEERNSVGPHYIVADPAEHVARCHAEIELGKKFFAKEIERLEVFLARVLRTQAIREQKAGK